MVETPAERRKKLVSCKANIIYHNFIDAISYPAVFSGRGKGVIMDLKQSKPIHLKCPKCGHDFACNTNRIEEDYQAAKIKANSIKKKMAELKDKNVSAQSPEYKRLGRLLADTNAQIVAIKKVRSALSDESERQLFLVFRKLVKGVIGEEKTMLLLKEAEDELCFRNYDMAVQRHSNFDGA